MPHCLGVYMATPRSAALFAEIAEPRHLALRRPVDKRQQHRNALGIGGVGVRPSSSRRNCSSTRALR